MRSKEQIDIVGRHAEDEVGDVIVGGVEPPPRRDVVGATQLDPDDPWPAGYRIGDTWPNIM